MSKYLLKDAFVSIDGVDFSNYAFSLDTPDSKEQVDVGGFNAAGNREFIQGARDQQATIGMLQSFGTASGQNVHTKLSALYESGSAFPFVIRPTSSGVGAGNPNLSGTATLYEYNGLSGQLNARGEVTAVLRPANGNTWAWATA